MRTLRLSLTGTVILALLGGLGGTVMAQADEGQASATYVTGEDTWDESTAEGYLSKLEMSDPRASGTFTTTILASAEYQPGSEPPGTWPGSEAHRAWLAIVNDEGRWSGHGGAVYHPDMGWVVDGWLAGEGPYEGLTLYLHAVRDDYSTPWMDFEGVIFEGPAPPMLGAVEPPAQ